MKVLCMDNSETIRKVVGDCVTDLGYEFFEAENGKIGIELALETPDLDLIVLDWNMPVLSGRETLERIRNQELLKDVKVFVLIKVENKDRVVEVIDMGADMYMLKPFNPNQLQDTIKELLTSAE